MPFRQISLLLLQATAESNQRFSDLEFILFFLATGTFLILLAWLNPGWFFQPNGRVYGLGSIVRDFGRNTARVVVAILGVMVLLGGLFIAWVAYS